MSKIIIIGPAYPLRGGLATFNERLAREFQNEGHEVIIYTFSLQYPNFLFPGKTQYSDNKPPTDLNIKISINSINPLNWWSVGKEIRRERADLVIIRYWLPFMGPCLGTISKIIKKKSSLKIIGLIDNALPHEKRPGDRIFTKYFTSNLDGFITMSEYVSNDLNQFTKKPIQLIHHPLYDNFGPKHELKVARKILSIPENHYIFLFFGFIRKYKGLDLLLDAFEAIKNDNISLVIAGEYYAGEDDLKDKIKNSSAKANILEHTRFIKDEDVGLYFSAADCVIQPYRNATQSGVTPLAYHFEIPMIVTNVGALPDLVPEELGIVCKPNITSLAQAMESMFLHFDREKFKIHIQKEKEKLSWSKFTSAIFELKNKIR